MRFAIIVSSVCLSAVAASRLTDAVSSSLADYELVLVPKVQKPRIVHSVASIADTENSDPVFGAVRPWEDVLDELTKALVCVCQQVVRTKPEVSGGSNLADNVCAEQYCMAAAKDPVAFGCEVSSSGLLENAGQLERCVAEMKPSQCYVYFPDVTDREKTMEYFRAIKRCVPSFRPNTTTTTTTTTTAVPPARNLKNKRK